MKRLVPDTGPILHLHEAAADHLLPLIGEIHVPPSALAELRGHAASLFSGQLPAWMILENLSSHAQQRATMWQQARLNQDLSRPLIHFSR